MKTIRITISDQTALALSALSKYGIYGTGPEEVAERFVDEGVQRFCIPPKLDLYVPPRDGKTR